MIVDVSADIVANARWAVGNAAQIHYSEENRRTWVGRPARTLPITEDCSSFATMLYDWAGAPDPNGLGYKVVGWTGSLLAKGKVIPASQVRPADLLVYGPGTGVHVVVVVEAGSDPLCVSHGQESDPRYIRASQDHVGAERRYLRFNTTKVVPDPPKPKPVVIAKKVFVAIATLIKSPITSAAKRNLTNPAPVIAPHPGGGTALCYVAQMVWQGIPDPTELNRLEGVGTKHGAVADGWWKAARQVKW